MAQLAASVFHTKEDAKRAIHALRDHGVDEDCISVLALSDDGSGRVADLDQGDKFETVGKDEGISTTTPGDAAKGAGEGAAIGAGLGIAAALASIFVPGYGLVAAGGALWWALGGAVGGAAAGALAGGVAGYLADMGVPQEAAHRYSEAVKQGGILVSVHDTDSATMGEIRQIFDKYNGHDTGDYPYTPPAYDPDQLDATNRRLTDEATGETLAARNSLNRESGILDLDDDEVIDATTGSEGSASGRLDTRRTDLR